jgi:hypothetical protein
MAGLPGPATSGSAKGDPRLTVGLYMLGQLIESFKKHPKNSNYRRSGNGAWTKIAKVDRVSVNPTGYSFYAQHSNSLRDDGSGTCTGTASAFIKNPVTFAKLLLTQFGGLSAGDFETGAGVFGNFLQAASDLDALVTGDWEIKYLHLQPGNVSAAIDRLMAQAPLAIWQSSRTGKWMAEVFSRTPSARQKYKDAAGNVYKWHYLKDMLPYGEVVIDWTPPDDIVNEVHVHYGMSAINGQYTGDCWVGPDGSDDGLGTRDQTGAIGTSTDREVRATDSRDEWDVYNPVHVWADQIYRPEQAKVLRNFIFDSFSRPRMTVQFNTWNLAAGIEPNMVTYLDNVMNDDLPVPRYPGHGGAQKGWDEFHFLVVDCQRIEIGKASGYQMSLEEIL